MDGSFHVHEWCLYNSDNLLTLHQEMILIGRTGWQNWLAQHSQPGLDHWTSYKASFMWKNFEEKNNKTFNLKKFRKAAIRIVFDALHGISTDNVKLPGGNHKSFLFF